MHKIAVQKLSRYFFSLVILLAGFFLFINTKNINKYFLMVEAPSVSLKLNYTVENNKYIESAKIEDIDLKTDYNAQREKNVDTKGWLYIPNTGINDPVLQSKDNDYYLRRSIDKKYSFHGCYFADFREKIESGVDLPHNTIIYGHNIYDDGTKFSQLLKFADWEHMASNPYIYLQTEDRRYIFKIYAVYYTFIDFYYIIPSPTEEQFDFILSESKKRSEYVTDVDVKYTDKIITLSTCCYKYKTSAGKSRTDQRFVIQGVLIDENNLPEYNLPDINPNIKLPTDEIDK